MSRHWNPLFQHWNTLFRYSLLYLLLDQESLSSFAPQSVVCAVGESVSLPFTVITGVAEEGTEGEAEEGTEEEAKGGAEEGTEGGAGGEGEG